MNRTMKSLAGWTGLALTLGLSTAAGADDGSALAFMQDVYKPYETGAPGFVSTEKNASRFFVKPVAHLIAKDSNDGTAVGALDVNPFTCGQDWRPEPIKLEVEPSRSVDKAEIVARFRMGTMVAVRHSLTKTAAGWRIADIHWNGDTCPKKSLVGLLSKR